ncbi:MAG TPA: DUF5679 domain-containing protein [Candidatus Paceibacterota bacterium]
MDQPTQNEPVMGYCVKCREKRPMKGAQEVSMPGKGGERRAMKGNCEVCGTGMYRILGKKK